VLDVVARDLARSYARGTEKKVGAYLATLGGAGTPLVPGEEVAGFYDVAAAVFNSVGILPDVAVMSPDVWAKLGGLTATDGRPVFPVLSPSNAAGDSSGGVSSFAMNLLGLRPVVGWSLPVGTLAVAASEFIETYEAHQTTMRAEEPTILGLAMGIGGAVAAVLTHPGAWAKLTLAAD
jgi:hypothetical protein